MPGARNKEARAGYPAGQTIRNFEPVDMFRHEFKNFFDAVVEGKKNLNSVDDSIRILEIVEKIRRAG